MKIARTALSVSMMALLLSLAFSCIGDKSDVIDSSTPDSPAEKDPKTDVDPEPKPQTVTDSVFRFATYNVLVNEGRREEMQLGNCSSTLGKVIRECNADIICFNEIDQTFASQLPSIAKSAGVTNYSWDIKNPNQVTSDGYDYCYANGLAYNVDKFKLISRGMCWYTSDGKYTTNSSVAYLKHVPKHCTLVWSRLRHIGTSKSLYVISTHFPLSTDGASSGYSTGQAHALCANALNSFASGVTDPCIVGADLNSSSQSTDKNAKGHALLCTEWNDVYDVLNSNGKLDRYYVTYSGTLSGSSAKYLYSVEKFTKNHPERRIDHIMYKNGKDCSLTPRSYDTVTTGYYVGSQLFCPSDHLPLTSEFIIHK